MITKKQSGAENKSFPEQHLEIRLNIGSNAASKHHEAIACDIHSDRSKINTNRNLNGPPINVFGRLPYSTQLNSTSFTTSPHGSCGSWPRVSSSAEFKHCIARLYSPPGQPEGCPQPGRVRSGSRMPSCGTPTALRSSLRGCGVALECRGPGRQVSI